MIDQQNEWPKNLDGLITHPKFQRFLSEMSLKGLADRTVKDYGRVVVIFLEAIGKRPDLINEDDIKSYLIDFKDMGASTSKQKIALAAIHHFWDIALKREWTLHKIIKIKRKQTIPESLTHLEVMAVLDKVKLFKFRVILYTLYCTGMRLNEGINLRVKDVDGKRMTIRVRTTKGGDERIVPMPGSLYQALRKYWTTHRNPQLIFPMTGRSLKQQALAGSTERVMHHTSIQQAMRKAAEELGITQQASPHILRHSYASHLLEKGLSFRLIQLYLGHKSPLTTVRYTHLTQAALSSSQQLLSKMMWDIRMDDDPKKYKGDDGGASVAVRQ